MHLDGYEFIFKINLVKARLSSSAWPVLPAADPRRTAYENL
jgi:hypothetical protein